MHIEIDWKLLQQILLTMAPVGALSIAWFGLHTWRRQLQGSYDFDLSRRLLLSLYKCREAIRMARNPFVQPGEAGGNEADWERLAYEKRWRAVGAAMSELQVAILEAEASWGEGFQDEAKELHKVAVRLMTAIRHYLSTSQPGPSGRLFGEEDQLIIWGEDDDKFGKKLNAAVEAFEVKIKPKLGRKK